MKCNFCFKECKHNNAKAQHELRCKFNPNRRVDLIEKFKAIAPDNTGKIPWNKGLSSESDIRIENLSKKLSLIMKDVKISGVASSEEKEKLRREKIRTKIIERYSNGWEVKCGRAKKIDYYSQIAGQIKVDGNWELLVAQFLDKIKVQWERNKKRFSYTFNNKKSTYCPDFYVIDWECYIEIKGYETEKDLAKWKQFPNKLEIWKKDKLKELGLL